MYTVKDFIEETDAALGVCVMTDDKKVLHIDKHGNFTENIFDAADFPNDEDAIILMKDLRKLGINAKISFWFNALDDMLIATNMTVSTLNMDANEFKKLQAQNDKNWIEWFKK